MAEESCVYTIKSMYGELSEKERLIADYILENLKGCGTPEH